MQETTIDRPRFRTARLRALLVAASVVCGVVLLVGMLPAEAQGDLQIEVPTSELHHAVRFQANLTNAPLGEDLDFRYCYGEQTGSDCESTNGGRGQGENPIIDLTSMRLLVADGEVIDCAVAAEPCWLEVQLKTTVVRAQLRYSAERPLPKLFIDPQPVAVGDYVTLTTNEFLGDPDEISDGGRAFLLYQCPTRRNPTTTRHCRLLDQFSTIGYGSPIIMTPLRILTFRGKVVDCANKAGSCELVMTGVQKTGTPLVFEPTSALPKETAELSKSVGLTNFEAVELDVQSPIIKSARVLQCGRKAGSKIVCDSLAQNVVKRTSGDDVTSNTITVKPRRYLFSARNTAFDCNAAGARCFVVVKAENGRHRIGKRMPITFDPDEQVEQPRVTIPDGPFADGEEIDVEVLGLAANMKVIVTCADGGPCAPSAGSARANATGTAVVRITLTKDRKCTAANGTCELVVRTNPRTTGFRVPIVFE